MPRGEVRRTFPHADLASAATQPTVCTIKGNAYRLIVPIRHDPGTVSIKDLHTHAEYDKGAWKA